MSLSAASTHLKYLQEWQPHDYPWQPVLVLDNMPS